MKPKARKDALSLLIADYEYHGADRAMLRILKACRRDRDMLDALSLLPQPGDVLIVATGSDKVTIHLKGKTLRAAIRAAMSKRGSR